ncbi:DEAD/DEAH box helicase [Evansella clarkii]|uniref:DEAD/DEAH box helicase n=1 Tax=Evansella clarkii TaxID=79879 RepID=UPI000B44D95C|nr:DEAD/DEAH box helicase [Evansella clarkii]
MLTKFQESLINIIKTTPHDRTKLLVLKGFPHSWLSGLKYEKLFSFSASSSLLNLYNSKMQLITEAVNKLNNESSIYWCTLEELLSVGTETISPFCEIHIINNNLYKHFYPLNYEIENIEMIYEEYYEEIEKHTDIPEDIQYISNFYGDIKKTNTGSYYITYIDQLPSIDLFSITKRDALPVTNQADTFIELSDDEESFLNLLEDLDERRLNDLTLYLTWRGNIEQFPQGYSQRLLLIRSLYPSVKIFHFQKQTESASIARLNEYENILEQYWGFKTFRTLKMYKNVDDYHNPKQINHISQAQIINDLVSQGEYANSSKSFRDIFVTSPTGAGKSVMFQIPAIYLAEKYNLLTIVISPLIGLMKDQVYSLQEKNVNFATTINSEISPVEKMNITNRIADGEISILYISPETLLSRSDIKMLIGDRKIGLFIVDEAHIVTTWGKAFRSDYWYLGSYLQKLRKEMQFPIATFTATAIYGGVEDMYSETRDSLLLTSPINYFGYVKRDDIKVSLKRIDTKTARDHEYRQQKYALLHERLKRLFKKRKKVLVYFPLVSLIKEFNSYMEINAKNELSGTISMYYGSLKKEKKNDSFLKFKNNDSYIMLATKAFGMGIDIPDIDNVIHFAPTGNVCDYIQEIGRAARDLEEGKAYFDFLSKDFNHVKRLHGISTIKKSQLIQVMDKILMLYKKDLNKKRARNLLISSEEFRYIFEKNSRSDMEDDLDNKLKTALLIIEKDFINRIGFSPIIARPRSVFSVEYIKIKRDIEEHFKKQYNPYIKKIKSINDEYFGSIYKINLKELWEDKYKEISFPKFKYLFHQKDDQLKFEYIEFFESVFLINLNLQKETPEAFLYKTENIITKIEEIFNPLIISQKQFTIEQLTQNISNALNKSKYQAEAIANQLIQSIISYQRTVNYHRNHRMTLIKELEKSKGNKYQVYPSLNEFMNFIKVHVNKVIQMSDYNQHDNTQELFVLKSDRSNSEKTFISLGLLEMLDLLLYEVKGGDSPEIFIRVNSQLQIENTVNAAEKYQNTILNNVHQRHKISVAMLTYLFKNEVNTEEFWDSIEDYFLGRVPQEVIESS